MISLIPLRQAKHADIVPTRPRWSPPKLRTALVAGAALVLAAALVITSVIVMTPDTTWSPTPTDYLDAQLDGAALVRDDPVAAGLGAALDREKYGLDVVATAGYRDGEGAPVAAVLAVEAKAPNLAGVLEVIEGTQRQLGAKRSVEETAGLQIVVYRVDDPAQVTYVAHPRPEVLVVVTSPAGSQAQVERVLSAVLDAGSS